MLFNKKKPVPQKSVDTKQIDKYLAQQSRLLSSLSKNDGTLQGQIKSYEYAFLVADPPLQNATSHELRLAELYIKAGQNDKAWGYLNKVYSDHMADRDALWKVRDLQAKILKKEGRYMEALEMYVLKYAEKVCDYKSQVDMIEKDIRPCINKLKWDEEQTNRVIHIIKKECGKFNTSMAIKEYRKLVKN